MLATAGCGNLKKWDEIVFKNVTGESACVDDQVCARRIEKLPQRTKEYKSENEFNAEETGLYYKCLPDKTSAFKEDMCHGGKNSKERIAFPQ